MELPKNPYEQEYAELVAKRRYSTDYYEELNGLWQKARAFNEGAKAEAKKLVGQLDETYNSLKAQGGFQISREEWQALKKEVEDG